MYRSLKAQYSLNLLKQVWAALKQYITNWDSNIGNENKMVFQEEACQLYCINEKSKIHQTQA